MSEYVKRVKWFLKDNPDMTDFRSTAMSNTLMDFATKLDRQAAAIEAYKQCPKPKTDNCPDIRCWVQVYRDELLDEIYELKKYIQKSNPILKGTEK